MKAAISWKYQNEERNCYGEKNLDCAESFFHVLESMLRRLGYFNITPMSIQK